MLSEPRKDGHGREEGGGGEIGILCAEILMKYE